MISVAACINRHLVLASIDSTSLRHTHASHLQAPIKKPLGSAEKHNLREIIGLTCRYAIRWNMLCRRQSIGVTFEGRRRVKRSRQNEKINPSPVARWPAVILNMQYALTWGSHAHGAARFMKENQYSISACQSVARGAEAYLEQSSPAPPPCMPTILREFSVDWVVL